MEPSELLRRLVEVLESLDLPYFVTGSTATIFYGEPRFTADIDVVVRLTEEAVPDFAEAFEGSDFYLDVGSIHDALSRETQFNVIHPASGLKVDVMIPEESPFDQMRFERARRVRPDPEFEAMFATPEDVILMKMVYFREGGSEKHLRDIAGVVKISGDALDRSYLAEWARRLEVTEIWHSILVRLEK
ncbi:MAG: hypothetical protein R3234_03290 [Thermoanaerobaculia bacterium]|nr:hypothetical protein [Thermoanaerobaculia bacterium]